MRNHLARVTALTAFSAIAWLGLGCEDRPESALEPALEQLQTLDRGYIPDDADGEDRPSPAQFRAQTYRNVIDQLEQALPGLSDSETVLAHRLLDQAHAGLASPQISQLSEQHTGHLRHARVLDAQLTGIENASERMADLTPDGSTRIAEIRDQIDIHTQTRDGLLAELEDLEQELELLQQQREEYLEQAQAAFDRSASLEAESFVAEGDDRFDLADEAEDVFLDASDHDARADELQAEIDILESRIELTQHELVQTEQLLGRPEDHEGYWAELDEGAAWLSLRDQIRQYEEGLDDEPGLHAAREEDLEQASVERDELIASLQLELTELTETLDDSIEPQFDNALGHLEQAREHLQQAANQASGAMADTLGRTLALRQIQTLELLSDHYAHLHAFGSYYQSIQATQDRLAEPVDTPFYDEQAHQALIERQQRLAEQIEQLAGETREAVEPLTEHADESIAERAQRRLARIDQLEQRVGDFALN